MVREETTGHWDDVGEWQVIRRLGARARQLTHASATCRTAIRNAFSCLTGVLGNNIDYENYNSDDVPSTAHPGGRFVGQWFVDNIITDATGHQAYATGDVAWSCNTNAGICPGSGSHHYAGGGPSDWPLSRRAKKSNKAATKHFETVNTTRAGPLLARLVESDSVFLGTQEHHVPVGGLDSMAVKVRNVGYKFCATGAAPSGNSVNGTSGGASVCVKACYGVNPLHGVNDSDHPWTLVPGRAAGVKILGIIRGGLVVVSVYLHTGEDPNSEANWAILTRVAEVLNLCRKPFVVCGDFQCTPAALVGTKWLEVVKGSIRSADKATCITHRSAREIDFFVVSHGLEAVIPTPEAVLLSAVATHCPVQASMVGNPRALTVKAFATPKGFPRHKPFGPMRQPRPWEAFKPDEGSTAIDKMEQLAVYWISQAEIELCFQYDCIDDATGAPLQQFVGRGSRPKVVNIVPLAHPTAGKMHCDVRSSFWQSVSNRIGDIHRWLKDYRCTTDEDGNILVGGTIWQQYGFTRHIVGTVQKLFNRFRTPPKTITRLDLELLKTWKFRIYQISVILQTILSGGNVVGTELISFWALHLEGHVNDIQKTITNTRSAEFGQWLDDQLASGAGGIHAATKDSVGCMTDQVTDVVPGQHAAQTIVDMEVIKWAQPAIWRAWPSEQASDDDFQVNRWFSRQDDFPPLRDLPPVEKVRSVSSTFPWKTSVGSDGLHPRVIECLSDQALKVLSLLFVSAEAVSKLPELFRIISLFTRAKKSGSYRVVGNLPTFY